MQMTGAHNNSGKTEAESQSASSTPDGQIGMSIKITQSKALSLISEYLPEGSPVQVSDIAFKGPDLVQVAGSLPVSQITDSSSLPTKLLTGILPDTLSFEAAFRISCQNGVIAAKPASLSVENVSVPVSLLPASVSDSLSSMLNDRLSAAGFIVQNVKITDGSITVDLE
jgi:hypothetical protein